MIIRRTRKANGKNNSWCNRTQDKHTSVDFSKIKDKLLENIEELPTATPLDNNVEILEAEQVKLTSWATHNMK